MEKQNNIRIAKNTLSLYFRQIVVLLVSIYTSRIVLQILGVTDYGINNVVGGIVGMFAFFNSSLMTITQRFLNIEIEKGSESSVKNTFSTILILYAILGIVIFLLGETIGLWFIKTKLIIPPERMDAAKWVYQFALFGMFLTTINAPFRALIIVHEDMPIYGYLGILEAIMKLIISYLLVFADFDKLIAWSTFGFLSLWVISSFFIIICYKKYPKIKFAFYYDGSLFKELIAYSKYLFINSILTISRVQIVNIILNIFFGPAINAARGLAVAVENALISFCGNFRQALNPQITKAYARKDDKNLLILLDRGMRFSFFLMLIFSVPMLLKTEFILKLWLKNVPEYTTIFLQLIIANALLESIVFVLFNMINATGSLRIFYSAQNIYLFLILVFTYIICKAGCLPQHVFIIPVLLLLLSLPVNIFIVKKQLNFSFTFFIRKILLPIFFVSVTSFIPFYFIKKLFPDTLIYSFIIIFGSMLWVGVTVILFGMTKKERNTVINLMKGKSN